MQPLCSSVCNSTNYAFIKRPLKREEDPSTHQQNQSSPTTTSSKSVHFWWASPFAAAAAILTLSTAPSLANPPASIAGPVTSQGAALFHRACIGCHDMGGNILQPGATLFTKDLERNGVATEQDLYNITYYGKGRMPGFGEKCTPRGQCTFGSRLQEDEIRMLAEFVKLQAGKGWPKVESYGD